MNRWAAIREQTGQEVGPPCYSLVRSRAAMGCRRSPQVATSRCVADGRVNAPRHSQAHQLRQDSRATKSATWCGMPTRPDGSKHRRHSRPCKEARAFKVRARQRSRTRCGADSTRVSAASLSLASGNSSRHPSSPPCHRRHGAATPSTGSSASARGSAICPSTRSPAPSVQEFVDGLTVGPWAKVSTLRLLRSILEVAREDGRIHRNPAHGVSAGRIPARERHRYLTAHRSGRLGRRPAATRATS